MANLTPSTSTVRDQFAAYEDVRFKGESNYSELGELFDKWLETERVRIRREALLEARDLLDGSAKTLTPIADTEFKRGAVETLESAATKIHRLAWS